MMVTDKLKKSMSKEVYLVLKRQILDGTLNPGDRLIEMTIANELNVSRTPVREALKQLEADGLVSTFPRKGSIVSKISVGSAMDMMEIRVYLEMLACVLIARQKKEKDFQNLWAQITALEKAVDQNDREMFTKHYTSWCYTISHAVKNKPLQDMLSDVYLHIQRLLPVSLLKEDRTSQALKELKVIYAAMEAEDIPKLEKAIKKHVLETMNEMENNVDYRNFRK